MDQIRDLISTADQPAARHRGIPDIDTTAADTLKEIYQELSGKGITLAIARANSPLRETLRLTSLENLIRAENFLQSFEKPFMLFESLIT